MLNDPMVTEMSAQDDSIFVNSSDTKTWWIPYPTGVGRLLARLPLLAYRLGLGETLNAVHLMVLTTRGRKTGKLRHTPVEYRRHGRKVYVVSAWGEQPDWFKNALAFSWVTLQLGGSTFSATVSRVEDPAEALRALHLFRRIAPPRYDAVLGRMIEADVSASTLPDQSGQFTILRLDITVEQPLLPGLPANLAWVWPMGLCAAVGSAVIFGVMKLRRPGG